MKEVTLTIDNNPDLVQITTSIAFIGLIKNIPTEKVSNEGFMDGRFFRRKINDLKNQGYILNPEFKTVFLKMCDEAEKREEPIVWF